MKATVKRHPLRKWRFLSDCTLERLAGEMRTSITTLSEIETGKRQPTHDILLRLVRHTGIPSYAFLSFRGGK